MLRYHITLSKTTCHISKKKTGFN